MCKIENDYFQSSGEKQKIWRMKHQVEKGEIDIGTCIKVSRERQDPFLSNYHSFT